MKRQNNQKSIIVIVRQVATANAFLPLIGQLELQGLDVIVLAFEDCFAILKRQFPATTKIRSFTDALPLLKGIENPRFMLTGSSEHAADDAVFWTWAKECHIVSMAFVDSWISYRERFTSPKGGKDHFNCIPDRIAVIDDLMHRKMRESGCDVERLVITGSPAFDAAVNYREHIDSSITERIQADLGREYVLFVAEPFNRVLFENDEKSALGYTETEVLTLTMAALERIGIMRKQEMTLAIKPHPRGMISSEFNSAVVASRRTSRLRIRETTLPPYDLAFHAKVVIGMTSLLLYEATLLGTPVVSIQPHRKKSSDIIDGHPNIELITNPDDAQQAIDAAYSRRKNDPVESQAKSVMTSAARLMAVIKQYI